MKIGFVRHSLFNRGGDKMILEYAGFLAGEGHDVTIWVNQIKTIFDIPSLVKIRRLTWPTKIGTVLQVFCTRFSQDILVADIIVMVTALLARNPGRVFYFAQDDNETIYRFSFMKKLVRRLYRHALVTMGVPVIAVSQKLASLWKVRFGIQAQVVMNGVNFDEFFPDPDPQLLNSKNARRAVVIFARSERRKGLDLARDVLHRLEGSALNKDVVVWVVGDSVQGLDLDTKNFGFVKPPELRKILGSADVFLFPSRSEGLPLMALQAMACGAVVVTTPAVEFAVDHENALVATALQPEAIFSKLSEALTDETLRQHLRQAAFAYAKKFDLMESKKKFAQILTL